MTESGRKTDGRQENGMKKEELYGRVFYACFANGGEREERYPFAFRNEYELVETGAVEAFLGGGDEFYRSAGVEGRRFVKEETFGRIYAEYQKEGLTGERFIHDKLELTGNQQVYYAVVSIQGMREAGKFGEYGKWYRMEFSKEGAYPCSVRDYSAEPGEMFREEAYQCNITAVTGEENDKLRELFRVYPDGRHIWHRKGKGRERKDGFGTLPVGTPVNSILVWRCPGSYYLCVEFYDSNQLPIGLFDMGYNQYVYNNYSDRNLPPNGGWGNRVPITVFISHFHDDHVSGLVSMAVSQILTGSYQYFFSNMDLHMPDTYQPPSFNLVVNSVAGAGGNVNIHDDQIPFQAPNPAFDYGLAEFDHPIQGTYNVHPHLHGMYVRCQTVGGRDVLMVGDTVYRGIKVVGGALNQPPRQGDLAAQYDVLIACHHGGNYHVDIAGHNYLPNTTAADYIPIPGNHNPTVIYSANGNGINSSHPNPVYVNEHLNQGWGAGIITNQNFSISGTIPGHIRIDNQNGYVEIT